MTAKLNPLVIGSAGRSGSTVAMRLLGGHPRIAAHMAYPCELHLMSYVTHPGRAAGDRSIFRYKFRGAEKLLERPIGEGRGLRARGRAQDYRRIGREAGKRPKCFIEKARALEDICDLLGGFPDLRMVLLIRDPRDVFLSARAFNDRRGYVAFFDKEKHGDSDEAAVAALRRRYKVMITNAGRVDSHTVRYEDLMTRPRRALKAMLDWLGLKSSRGDIDRMIANADGFDDSHHRTSDLPELSVGRWRREMPVPLRRQFEVELRDVLARFGYT